MDAIIVGAVLVLLVAIPILVYYLRVKPEIDHKNRWEIVLGVLTLVFMFDTIDVAIGDLAHPFIVIPVLPVSLFAHWVLWLTAAVRKKSAGKPTRLSPVLPLFLGANAIGGGMALFFIAGYAVLVITEPKEYE